MLNSGLNTQIWFSRRGTGFRTACLNKTELTATLKGTKTQALAVIANFKMKKEYREKINNQFNLK